MNKRRKVVEIILAGIVAATVTACVSTIGAQCGRTASGGWQCNGGFDPENNVVGM